MKYVSKKFIAIVVGAILVIGGLQPAWAMDESTAIVAERSFQHVSRTAPLIVVKSPEAVDSSLSNVQTVNTVEEQRVLLGISDGSPLEFEVDTEELERGLDEASVISLDMKESMAAVNVTSESLQVHPATDYGPFSVTSERSQSFVIEIDKPSMLGFVIGKRQSSNKLDTVHVVLSDANGNINSEWDIDQEVEAHDFGSFFLKEGKWTLRLSTSGSVSNIQFYYETRYLPEGQAYEAEPNSSTDMANDVPINQAFCGVTYDPAGEVYLLGSYAPLIDVDMLRFVLSEDSRVEIDLITQGKISYQVYNDAGQPLRTNASNNESEPYIAGVTPANTENGRQVECGILPAGTYYMHITGFNADVWKKPYTLLIVAAAAENPSPGPNPSPVVEKRSITISVRGNHGTTDPIPGTYEIERTDSCIVNLIPDKGYIPSEVWVDGILEAVEPGDIAWTLPPSENSQTFEVKYEPVEDSVNDGHKDISKATIYINGVSSSNSPQVYCDDVEVVPNITVVHHLGTGTFKRLYPESFDVGSTAVYHFMDEDASCTRIAAFSKAGDECIVSDEYVFDTADMAQAFIAGCEIDLSDLFLNGWTVGNAAYVQLRFGAGTREAFDAAMQSQYGRPENGLMFGPNEGMDYIVSFSGNGKPGLNTVTITGCGSHYGTKTASFNIVSDNAEPDNTVQITSPRDSFSDISVASVYINGVPASASPKVMLTGPSARPNVLVVHHAGSQYFKRLYPEDFDFEEASVYHYQYEGSIYTEVVAFEKEAKSSIVSTEILFEQEWMAQRWPSDIKNAMPDKYIDGWSDGRIAYVQLRLNSGVKEVYDDTMRERYSDPKHKLIIGPSEGLDYIVTYANNDSPGTGVATATGKGNCFGSKSASFLILGEDSSAPGASIPSDSYIENVGNSNIGETTPLVQTGASTASGANGISSGKTGLVQTGDALRCGTTALALAAVVTAIIMVRKRRTSLAGTVASTPGSIECDAQIFVKAEIVSSAIRLSRSEFQSDSCSSEVAEPVGDVSDVEDDANLSHRETMAKKLPRII